MSENECHDEVCITCSDHLLEVAVTAVSADGGTAQAVAGSKFSRQTPA